MMAVGMALGMANGLLLGSAGNNGNNILPGVALLVIPRKEYDFAEQMSKEVFVNYTEIKEKDNPSRIEVTNKNFDTLKFYVTRVEKREDTFLMFGIKDEGVWEINTFSLLRRILKILNEKKVNYEIYL